MSLPAGTRIGPYEVVSAIGAGGMGEVYRARDGKLNRDVAIKVLPDLAGRDPERLARFQREAQVLASINHPNIAAIYGVESSGSGPALILELVEGPTLADRIAAGAIPPDEALPIARQIAEALEAAHALGIIHRDLKPANIKLRPDGTVKVLDFGLAKAFGAGGSGSGADPVHSPTFTAATQAGVVLGTAAYMAPEQARGRPVDKRADVWAFGCVLFECLTAQQTFGGDTVSDIIAAILTREPDVTALPAATPARIRDLIRRCLQRDPKRRLHDIADARIEIQEAIDRPDEHPPVAVAAAATPVPVARGGTARLPWLLVAVLTIAASALAWVYMRAPSGVVPLVARVAVNLPEGFVLGEPDWPLVALSPDGTRMVVVGMVDGVSQLYLRRIDRDELTALPGTRGATRPFFSPDGAWVAFTASTTLKKISLDGGPAVQLCRAEWGGGAWGRDGRIVFTQDYNSGLSSVPEGGGTPQVITSPDKKSNELGHWWPQILPDGDTVIFTSLATPIEKSRILARSLKTGQQKVIAQGAVFGRYLPSGHLLFARTDTVMVAPFDLRRTEVSGPAVPLAEGVLFTPQNAAAQLAVADAGVVALIRTTAVSTTHRIVAIDRKGNVQVVREHLKTFGGLRVSPDGQRIALGVIDGHRPSDVWIHDLDRGSLTRLTFGPSSNFNPVWTPDGRRIIYASERPVFDLYVKSADGASAEAPLSTGSHDKYPTAVTPDGSTVLVTTTVDGSEDQWGFPLTGGGQPQPLISTPASERAGRFSPDGRWLAFSSDESDPGGTSQIYVRSFPAADKRYQVSTEGGTEPVWGPGGHELFYVAGSHLMAATMSADGSPGKPVSLLDVPFKSCQFTERTACYDVSPDGQRFYALQPEQPLRSQASVDLLLNAFEELRRVVR